VPQAMSQLPAHRELISHIYHGSQWNIGQRAAR
jgi:hypothetical protein